MTALRPAARPVRLAVAVLVAVWLLAGGLVPAATAQDATPTPSPDALATPVTEAGAPVVVNGQELFRLHTRVGSVTPTERAQIVADRIGRLANNPFVGELAVSVVDTEEATDVVVGDQVIVTVSDEDAAAEERERHELAQEWAAAIQTAILSGQENLSGHTIAAGMGLTLLVLLALALLLWLINRGGDWLVDRLDPATESGRIPPTLARSEFYQTGQFSRLVRSGLRLMKLLLAVFLITVAIPVILRAFPQTEALGQRLRALILSPLARLWDLITSALPDVVFLLVLAFITWLITRLIFLLFREVGRGVIRLPSFEPEWAAFTARMLNFLVIIIALIVGFTSLPISQLPVFQGISAFLALLFTLASTSALANIIAGVILTYTGAFHLGDIIQIQTTTGEVLGKYLLTTRVRTFKNEVVSFPNSLVLSTSVTNYSRIAREKGLTLHTTVTIGYDVPWQRVHELLLAAAQDTEHLLKRPEPFVLQTALNDYHISYELNAFTRHPELLPRLYSDLHRHIHERFDASEVEIMSPAYMALRDGNTPTLPPADDRRQPADESPPTDNGRQATDH